MTFLFDLLPLQDIIHETIVPMLDYESIIQLNRCLSPPDRYRARFTKTDILSHELFVVADLIKKGLTKLTNVTGRNRKERVRKKSQLLVKILQEFDSGKRTTVLLKYHPGFHTTVVEKLNSLSSPQSEELIGASKYFKKKISNLSKYLLPKVVSVVPKTDIIIPLRRIPAKGATVF